MKIQYFADTDTLYIQFRENEIAEIREIDEDTLVELDRDAQLCAMTVEHAKERADLRHFSFEHIECPVNSKETLLKYPPEFRGIPI